MGMREAKEPGIGQNVAGNISPGGTVRRSRGFRQVGQEGTEAMKVFIKGVVGSVRKQARAKGILC